MPESSKRSRASTASNDEESNTKRQCRTTEGVRCSFYITGMTQEEIDDDESFQLIVGDQKIKDVCLGIPDDTDKIGKHAYILFQNGNLKQWGHDQDRWDLVSHKSRKIAKSIYLDQVMQIACSCFHAIAVKRDGSVWTWGDKNPGRLGRQIGTDPSSPGRVVGLQHTKMQRVACSPITSFALSDEGTLYSWGSNKYNGHGLNPDDHDYLSHPSRVQPLPPITEVVANTLMSGALATDGKVFTWGLKRFSGHYTGTYNDDTLGDSDADNILGRPTLLSPAAIRGEEIVQLSCGVYHMAAVSRKGSVFTWGLDKGQPDDMPMGPALVEALRDENIFHVSCGEEHTVALSATGEVFGW